MTYQNRFGFVGKELTNRNENKEMVHSSANNIYSNCSDFRHLCVDNCDSYERSNKLKISNKIGKEIQKEGIDLKIDGYLGDIIIGNEGSSNAVYIRIPFVSIQAAESLMNSIVKKGLVLNVGNSDCSSIGL